VVPERPQNNYGNNKQNKISYKEECLKYAMEEITHLNQQMMVAKLQKFIRI